MREIETSRMKSEWLKLTCQNPQGKAWEPYTDPVDKSGCLPEDMDNSIIFSMKSRT